MTAPATAPAPAPAPGKLPPGSCRCGRVGKPVMHLTDLAETLRQRRRHGGRDPVIALCCDLSGIDQDPDGSGPEPSEAEWPGWVDCVRYCPDCLREAARFAADGVTLTEVGAR